MIKRALLFSFVLYFSSLAQSATAEDGSSSAAVLGSCNVVQQNVNAAGSATIINQIDCASGKLEDNFSLRYVWLDGAALSLYRASNCGLYLRRIPDSTDTLWSSMLPSRRALRRR